MWFGSHQIAIYDLNQTPPGHVAIRPKSVNHVSEQA